MIIVIGCLRSGTLFTTKLLRRATGLQIGHDALERDGGVSGFFAAAGDETTPRSRRGALQFADLILHQVRNPLHMIRSMEAIQPNTWQWICDQLPDACSMEQPLIERAANYWIHWNRRCAKIAACTYRVESLKPIAEMLGVKQTWNSRASEYTTPVLTIHDIPIYLRHRLRLAAEKYGYRAL